MQKQDLRKLFLITFTKTLISHTRPKKGHEEIFEKIKKGKDYVDLPEIPSLPKMPKVPRAPKISSAPIPEIKTNLNLLNVRFPETATAEQKILYLLRNPTTTGIECLGPGKNILINNSGKVQATSLTLSSEDIDEVLLSISEKTRIPMIIGVFKAAMNNLIITAIISEYAGSRFMIQKRSPF